MKQWFKRNCPLNRRASSTSRYPNALDARPTTTATDVTGPLPVSPAQGTSCVDVVANQPSKVSTVPGSTGIGDSDQKSPLLNGNPTSYIIGAPPTPTSASFQATRESLPSDGPPVKANYTGAAGINVTAKPTASQTAPRGLPSQFEETLAVCPRFRILLVGNTGVGKSSLVSSVFNIVFNVSLPNSEDGTPIDIAHDRIGKADISYGYNSEQNPRFILHDSMGFEPGSTEKSEIVTTFLRTRAECSAGLPEQVHAIWLCIETPRMGSRLLQTGDEDLLMLAKELKIPVIVVLTKYDLLVTEHYRACSQNLSPPDRKVEAQKLADGAFSEVTKELKKLKVPFAPVSTLKKTQKDYGGMMLVHLTQVTRDNLRDHVAGSLWALWATAQQINARQKVELSISEGLKKYWQNLGESVVFREHPLVDCIARIHDDILKIWNFNDPEKVLYGEEFLKKMIGLVEPLSDQVIQDQRATAGVAANVVSVAGAVGSSLVLPALGTMIGISAFQFLRRKYQKGVSTATYLAAYIVDLTLVLFDISTVVTVNPPRSLSRELVMDALEIYKSRSSDVHAQVKKEAFTLKLEEKIASVIRDALPSVESIA